MRFLVKAIFLAALLTCAATAKADVVIDQLPVTINKPGTYRLESDLQAGASNAIEINSSHVTIDLNGYKISALNRASIAIYIPLASPPNAYFVIKNGWIDGFDTAIAAYSGPLKIDNVILTNNNFAVTTDTLATITNSQILNNQSGIGAGTYSKIENNIVSATEYTAVAANHFSKIRNNIITGNAHDGINCADCDVISNILSYNGAANGGNAIVIQGFGRVEGNSVAWSDFGINCTTNVQCTINNNTIQNVIAAIWVLCPSLIYNNNMYRFSEQPIRFQGDRTQCLLSNNIPAQPLPPPPPSCPPSCQPHATTQACCDCQGGNWVCDTPGHCHCE
jgi:hypothetical protein